MYKHSLLSEPGGYMPFIPLSSTENIENVAHGENTLQKVKEHSFLD